MGAQRWVWVAILAGAMGLAGSAWASAASLDSSLVGAWASSAADCQRIFQRSGKGIVFRQPVDKFAQAAIIDPGQIRAASSTCRIENVAREKGSIRIDGECNDTISYTPQTLRIKVQGPGQITYSPSGDPALDTSLVRCRL